jgi:hypothetical protein
MGCVTSKETEQMFSAIEEQQAVLQNQIEDSKRLAARSDQLIDLARSQSTPSDGLEALGLLRAPPLLSAGPPG